jgi:hypothetical protein
MIIGVCGFIGSGKDTVADYLVNFHEFKRESFAGTLKDAVSAVFGWDRELLEGRSKKAREWREQVDPFWAERLAMPTLTPRWILQYWGTEVCRKGFHDDIWIAALENKLLKSEDSIVISDCRFPNEVESIKNAGGKVIWVERGDRPEWYDIAIAANEGSLSAMQSMRDIGVHSSEWAWLDTEFDHNIKNNGSIDDLYKQIELIVSDQISLAPSNTILC